MEDNFGYYCAILLSRVYESTGQRHLPSDRGGSRKHYCVGQQTYTIYVRQLSSLRWHGDSWGNYGVTVSFFRPAGNESVAGFRLHS